MNNLLSEPDCRQQCSRSLSPLTGRRLGAPAADAEAHTGRGTQTAGLRSSGPQQGHGAAENNNDDVKG